MAKQEHKQPLVHIVKRSAMPFKKALAIRAAAIVIALLLCGIRDAFGSYYVCIGSFDSHYCPYRL